MSSECSGTISCLRSSQCLGFSPPFSDANSVLCNNFLPSSPYILYIPSSDLNLVLIYHFFSRNFIVVMDWFFFCTLQFSSPFFCCFTHSPSRYYTSQPSGFPCCISALCCRYNWFCSHHLFLGPLLCLLHIFLLFQLGVFKNLILCSIVFFLANWPSFLR